MCEDLLYGLTHGLFWSRSHVYLKKYTFGYCWLKHSLYVDGPNWLIFLVNVIHIMFKSPDMIVDLSIS